MAQSPAAGDAAVLVVAQGVDQLVLRHPPVTGQDGPVRHDAIEEEPVGLVSGLVKGALLRKVLGRIFGGSRRRY